jgi:hypothetical protein
VEDRWDLQARLADEIPLDRVDALGDLVGQLCPSRLSIWPGIGPSVPSKASGVTEDSCIAFSSIVISPSSSSAR